MSIASVESAWQYPISGWWRCRPALVGHWSWAAEGGVVNKSSAAGLRTACIQVLDAIDDLVQAGIS